MAEINIPEKVLTGLREICSEEKIGQLILFGSRAKGKHNERSDIDIAAKFNSVKQFFRFQEKVNDLDRIPSLLLIDIIDLNSDMVSIALREDIKKDGVVIYEEI